MPIGELNPVPMEYLDLRLTIRRDHTVEREHSFHFAALRGSHCGHDTKYTVEILDEEGNTLICVVLTCCCNLCQPNCYPKIIRDRIPMPPNARLLRVWEDRDTMIYEENIPDPPTFQWKAQYSTEEGMGLEWKPTANSRNQDLRYLVQFEDRPGIWRGVAPRDTDTKITVPWEIFKRRDSLHIRVLASSGIATGVIDQWIKPEWPDDKTPPTTPIDQPPVVISGTGSLEPNKSVGSYLRATSEGGAVLRWYDESGAELSGSATLNLRELPDGQHIVRAVAVGGDALQSSSSFLIEKEGERVTFVREFKRKEPGEPHVHPHHTPQDTQEPKEK
jgi:hypothetical protein